MVTRETNILEAVEKYPVIGNVFRSHGLGCVGCMVSAGESLGEGIEAHGLDANAIIAEINALISETK